MDVARLRQHIPTTQKMTYLNTGWEGPSPTSVIDAISEHLEYESHNGPTASEVLESGQQIEREAKQAVASLINASPSEVLLTENTTEGLNMVMNGLPWKKGDEIITCDLEHPSVLIPSYYTQERHGVNVRVLKVASDETPEKFLSMVDEALTDRTRMVFFSHIQYSTGLRTPVKEIRRLTKSRGVWMLLDGAQGPGHIRVDVKDIDCDFYSMPGQKWLLGPGGTGALYIKEEMIPLVKPMGVSYYAVKSHGLSGEYVPETDDIDKFLVSTTNAALRSGFVQAIRFVQGVGFDEIERRNLGLASLLKTGLSGIPGVKVLSPLEGPGCSGLVSFAIEGVDPKQAFDRLWTSHKILMRDVPYPPSLRASLHFFNTEEEVQQLLDAVRELAG